MFWSTVISGKDPSHASSTTRWNIAAARGISPVMEIMNGSRDIPESDWRHFKRLHEVLLERYCARVLDDVATVVEHRDGSAHDCYLRLWKLLKKQDKELGLAFDDFRRSTAVMQLAIMRSMGLLKDEDLKVFTPQ